MLIEILDDFDLEKIALSGQCFRVKRMQDGGYRFIFGDEVLYIREIGNHRFSVSCSLDAWRNTWSFYFDLRAPDFSWYGRGMCRPLDNEADSSDIRLILLT